MVAFLARLKAIPTGDIRLGASESASTVNQDNKVTILFWWDRKVYSWALQRCKFGFLTHRYSGEGAVDVKKGFSDIPFRPVRCTRGTHKKQSFHTKVMGFEGTKPLKLTPLHLD